MIEYNLHRDVIDAISATTQAEAEVMQIQEMQWRRCGADYPDYEVSDSGDVRRRAGEIRRNGLRVRGVISADGYVSYMLTDALGDRHHVAAHTLVAEAFIGPRPSALHEVAHNNGSKINNYYKNLRWATRAQNNEDRIEHGTASKGTQNGRATITDDDVRYIRRRYREIKIERGCVAELDEQFKMTRSQIIRIARYQAWGHVED